MLISSYLTKNINIEWKKKLMMMMNYDVKKKLLRKYNEYIIHRCHIFSIDKSRTVEHIFLKRVCNYGATYTSKHRVFSKMKLS